MANDDHPVSGQWDEPPGLFLEGDHRPSGLGHRSRRRRRMAVVAAAATCLAVVGVPVGLVLASGGPSPTPSAHSTGHHPKVGNGGRLGNGPAEHQVLSALSATTASGNFDVNYDLTQSSGSASSTTATTCVTINVAPSFAPGDGAAETTGPNSDPPTTVTRACGAGPQDASVKGQGTIDVNPMAMAVSADVSSFGSLAIRVDGTNYWEVGAGDNGLAPVSTDTGAGSPLSSFAGLVEGTLGQREGAIAMMGMASPTGFLDLSQQAVTGAAEVGTGEVGGKSVTEYEVSIDLAQLAQTPGITTEEANTIQAAVGVLDQAGYSGTKVKVAIDDAGFILEVTPVASFSDGGTVTLDATFSNFGCAGTVLMPGQQGATSPPAGCVSPDSTTTTTTTTTTTAPSTTDSATSTTG